MGFIIEIIGDSLIWKLKKKGWMRLLLCGIFSLSLSLSGFLSFFFFVEL